MSIKGFHLFFVVIVAAFCAFLGYWGLGDFKRTGNVSSQYMAYASFAVAAAMVPYTVWFLRKLRNYQVF